MDVVGEKAGKKTLREIVLENLDKILIVLAIVLLVVFYLHSQPQHRSKGVHKKVVDQGEETKAVEAEKDLT